MKQSYWHTYVQETDADEVERHLQRTTFLSGATRFELIYFEEGKNAPTLLISQGSGGHAYVFAELGYRMHLRGYKPFVNLCFATRMRWTTLPPIGMTESGSSPKDWADLSSFTWL